MAFVSKDIEPTSAHHTRVGADSTAQLTHRFKQLGERSLKLRNSDLLEELPGIAQRIGDDGVVAKLYADLITAFHERESAERDPSSFIFIYSSIATLSKQTGDPRTASNYYHKAIWFLERQGLFEEAGEIAKDLLGHNGRAKELYKKHLLVILDRGERKVRDGISPAADLEEAERIAGIIKDWRILQEENLRMRALIIEAAKFVTSSPEQHTRAERMSRVLRLSSAAILSLLRD